MGAAGVHDAVYAGTKWDHETVLPQSQRRMCLAALFQTFDEARRVIRDWLQWHNEERPHQALL
jgi:transposase InsO family protein